MRFCLHSRAVALSICAFVLVESMFETNAYSAKPNDPGSQRSLGASLSLQIPHPIWLDLVKYFNAEWDGAVGLGGFKIKMKRADGGTDISLGIVGMDVRARWHPLKGAFFLGTALGLQEIFGSASEEITFAYNGESRSILTTVHANITSFYLTPHFGWLWKPGGRIMLGVDLGWQFPFAASTQADIKTNNSVTNAALDALKSTQEYKTLYADVQNAGNKIGKTSLPYATILRFGVYF